MKIYIAHYPQRWGTTRLQKDTIEKHPKSKDALTHTHTNAKLDAKTTSVFFE